MRKKTGSGAKFLAFVLLVALLFTLSAVLGAKTAKKKAAKRAEAEQALQEKQEQEQEEQAAAEAEANSTGEPDKYSMQEFCHDNAMAVFSALKEGDTAKLKKLMKNPENAEAVMEFADWSKADFEGAVSMGSGSLTPAPDKDGFMDESERFFVYAGDTRYVFFIETLTSGYGTVNEGVSAIGVTTFSHFDATDYIWNGEPDDQSVLAGELFWNK